MRTEPAVEMDAGTSDSLAAIAHDCGFARQQHLSNASRRQIDVTSSRYRALRRN